MILEEAKDDTLILCTQVSRCFALQDPSEESMDFATVHIAFDQWPLPPQRQKSTGAQASKKGAKVPVVAVGSLNAPQAMQKAEQLESAEQRDIVGSSTMDTFCTAIHLDEYTQDLVSIIGITSVP